MDKDFIALGHPVRETMIKWFGDTRNVGPYSFLLSHGYYLCEGYTITKPVSAYTISYDEYLCISFLIRYHNFSYRND